MGKAGKGKMFRLSDYVRPFEAATIVGCTVGRIHQMTRDGEFRDLLPVGKNRVLISKKEVEKVAKSPAKTGRPRKNLAAEPA